MDQPRPTIQVVINGLGQPQGYPLSAPNGGQHHNRPLQVDEALQYSPMTSAPVFGLGTPRFICPSSSCH
jgi:cohesin loading factor subunit SCC2